MTIRFAPARNRNTVARGTKGVPPGHPANDDGASVNDQALLADTLRHFAIHGISAAKCARDNAIVASQAGDMAEFEHWLAICRMLDNRMAKALAANREFASI